MHAYRTHSCADLRASDVGSTVRLSGWIHRKRDHGGVLFVDLRDHYGLTQIVARGGQRGAQDPRPPRVESVVTITGEVVDREGGAVNPKLATGEIEVVAKEVAVQSSAAELPMPVAGEADYPEEIRLKYRYLDLRRDRLHANIMLRSKVIASIRRRMIDQGFTEFQTPILTAVVARGRARLSGAEPRPSRQILRASAGAADVQAAADGRRLRPLFPDRALLPRRGRPRRPQSRANSTSSTSR